MSDAGLYANTVFAALILSLPFVLSRRVWVEIVFMFVADVLLVANLMYCRTYYSAIPLDSYALVGNLKDFTASVLDSFRLSDILIPLTTIAAALLSRRITGGIAKGGWKNYTLLTAGALATAIVVSLFYGGFRRHYEWMREACYYSTCTTPVYTVFGNIIYDVATMTDMTETPQERGELEAWFAQKELMRPHSPLNDSVGARRNLVMVFCESFESWVIGAKIDGREITPRLNSLIADSTTFYAPNVVTQVAAGRSIDAQLIIEAGMLPLKNGVYSAHYHGNHFFTLPKAMRETFDTRNYLLSCDAPITWNQSLVARSFGIDTLLTRDSWHNDELVGRPAKLSDGSFIRQAIEKMRQGEIWRDGENAFVLFITYSGHNPFVLPENLKRITISEKYPERMRDYMTMANYTDYAVGMLIDYLRTRDDFDETLIVITGDHEGLASNRKELLSSPLARGVVDSGRHTPLIIINSPVGGRYDKPMGQIDIYPTLLNLLQLDDYSWHGLGQSVLDPRKPAFAIASSDNSVEGDTAAINPALLENIFRSRDISDLILRHDMLRPSPHDSH